MENLGELTAPARTQGCRVKTLNLAIAPGRNRQAADTTISPVIIKTVSCSVLAPARVIAIASSTPGKRCKVHGGKSTGPRTPEGLERSKRANWKHGYYSREAKAERSRVRAAILAVRYLRMLGH